MLDLYNDMVLTQKEMGFLGQNLELPPPAHPPSIMNTPTENKNIIRIKSDGMSPKVRQLNSRNKFVEGNMSWIKSGTS